MAIAVLFYELFKVINRRAAMLVVFWTVVVSVIEGEA
jgi:hypothetical protein